MLTEHKRVKHGEAPGTLNRGWLIALRELRGELVLQPFRKVQRRRDKRAIVDGLAVG